MPGLGDLFGRNGVIEQLLLWGLVNQLLTAEFGPLFTAQAQDVNAVHPLLALPPTVAADLAAHHLMTGAAAKTEAAKGGIDGARFAVLLERARVRIPPADLAEAVLRSYVSKADAEAQARPQGIDAGQLRVLTDLAGDAIGPQDAARALLRGLIKEAGTGPDSTSFEQAIAESRLHNKWGPVIRHLARVLPSPPELASGVVRNFTGIDQAAELAGKQGVDRSYLDLLVHLSGDAPGPQQLAEALRRGLVPLEGRGPTSTSFIQGIAEGRLADKWAPVIEGLSVLWPTPTDALDAQLKGQITAAEGTKLYERLGGDPEFHDWLLATLGDSPTPLEAAVMAARGIIKEHGTGPDVLSYDQAVKESRYRNKWGPAYRAVSRHLPAPGTIASMLAHGVITDTTGHTWLADNDLTPDVAAAYQADAEFTETSNYRGLTAAAVVDMYIGHLMTRDQATTILGALHVTGQAAALMLNYADLRYLIDSINRSVQRIATLYTGRKIATATAKDALIKLGIPATTVEAVISTWEIQAAADVKTLSESQIVDAWYYKAIDQQEAMTALEAIGYTPYDAWILLSNKAKGPLPGKPARRVAPPPGAVIPGVT